jgi:hypothetical protein
VKAEHEEVIACRNSAFDGQAVRIAPSSLKMLERRMGRNKIKNLRRTSIMQVNFVLYVEICSPMADLCCAAQFRDFQHWLIVSIVYHDRLLMLFDEVLVRRGFYIVIWSISDRCTRLGDRAIQCECVKNLWSGVGKYARCWRPELCLVRPERWNVPPKNSP